MAASPQAVAPVGALPYARPRAALPFGSRTIDQYVQTLCWTFTAILFCVCCYAIEKYVFRDWLGVIPDTWHRLFKNPAELPMRVFGIPHFVVALLFMLSSKRMRGPRSLAWLAGLTTLGAAFCWLFYRFGRVVYDGEVDFSPLALLVFYFYFLIHGFRDEAFFYKAYGELPKDQQKTHERIMVVLQLLMLGLLASLALPAYVLFGEFYPRFSHPALEAIFPASWPYAVRFASTFVPMLLIAVLALRRIARVFPDGLAGLWRAHRPILTVFIGSTGIILVALVSGPWSFNAVVLMHFVGWYIFARHIIDLRPPAQPPRSVWAWMRSTKPGFATLHLGLAALVLALLAVSTYAFGKQDFIELVIGSKVFFYWTIMHVTLSFFPR